MKICIPATVSKVTTMADKCLRLVVDTQEITDAEIKRDVFETHDALGYFFFQENPITEIPKNLPPVEMEEGEKTPGQRLRGVLFVYWEQKKVKESFEVFYRAEIEKLISRIKEKLN
jgi:hypothetical protein